MMTVYIYHWKEFDQSNLPKEDKNTITDYHFFWLCFVFILETETNQSSKDRDVEKFYIHCYWLPLVCVPIYKRGIKCDPQSL